MRAFFVRLALVMGISMFAFTLVPAQSLYAPGDLIVGTADTAWQRFRVLGLDVDGSGNAFVAQAYPRSHASVLKIGPTSSITLYNVPQVAMCVGAGIDLRSGDWIFSGASSCLPGFFMLLRATLRAPYSVSALTGFSTRPVPGSFVFPRHDPETDTFLLFHSSGRIENVSLGSPGAVTTVHQGQPLGNWTLFPSRDPGDGRFVIPTYNDPVSAFPPRIFRFDAANKSFQTVTMPASTLPTSATVAGSRHLCGLNEVWPGKAFKMLVSSPAEPGARYIVALGLDFHPGFRLADGRKIHLNPDPLFFWSLSNFGPFSGFQGTLDAKGEASATFVVPAIWALSGMRFYAAAVTLVNHRISVISAPLGVTIQ